MTWRISRQNYISRRLGQIAKKRYVSPLSFSGNRFTRHTNVTQMFWQEYVSLQMTFSFFSTIKLMSPSASSPCPLFHGFWSSPCYLLNLYASFVPLEFNRRVTSRWSSVFAGWESCGIDHAVISGRGRRDDVRNRASSQRLVCGSETENRKFGQWTRGIT